MVDATKMTRMRSALPEADVQFLREHFDRDLNYDSLVIRVTEYFSNPLDRKQYETFVRNYNAIWKSDKTTGYSNVDVNWVETDNDQKMVTPTAPDSEKSDKGNQMKSGGYQQSNTASAESKNNCMRCGESGHTSPFCTADYVMRSRRCFNCGKEGHRAAFYVVPRSSLRCKRCGQTGHVSWLCRRPWSQVLSMKNSTGNDGGKPAGSEPPKPKQPVGEYTTKMVYETSAPTTETVAFVAGGGNGGSQTESPTESPIEQKLSTISCEAQTIADMKLEDGFVTATLEVYSPHELVKVEGLLDTGASVGFIREDFAESLVSRGAGNVVNTPSKVRVKLADGTVRYMDKAWKCFVRQTSKQGNIVWKLLIFILMGGIGKPGIIIGRNQFKILGFAITRPVLCNDEQRCVVDDEQAEKRATGHPTTPVRPVIVCQSLDPYLKATECDIRRISDIFLRWRQMRDCDQPYLGIDWPGQSYLSNILPFGLAMSSSWLTANVREVLYRLSKQSEFESEVLPYMDDLALLVGDGKDIITQQHALVQRFEEDGFPVAVQETVWYNQKEAAKVLGVAWLGTEEDVLKVEFQAPSVPPTTRRSVLAMLNSLYDPLGFLLELSTKGRLIMRKIAAYDRDTTLPKDLCTEAADWMKDVQKVAETTKVPWLVDCKSLLVYVDASQFAWGVDVGSPESIRVVARGGLFDKEKFAKWSIVS
ncbi:hypothetical protein FOZ60_008812 [Perkinsus olseni]|uniref:CCHC-type domain-containing protein n=1 Tax=Perkinsus olseni TaxID=32597 RepID=A0A7J6NIF0_PEROL|nr:hypothetical protein FOZ60_008812 [Perkinsus olseni]